MLSRTAFSSLALLTFTIFLLANCATRIEPRASLPLTPPPIAPEIARFGPLADDPATPIPETITGTVAATVTATVTTTGITTGTDTDTLVLIPTPTPTGTAVRRGAANISPTINISETVVLVPTPVEMLPTITPTPAAIVLLPTATATPQAAANAAPVDVAPVSGTNSDTVVTASPPIVTMSVPLPPSYQAQGSFASQTVYTDSTIAQQQGTFTIRQNAAANAYGADQHVTLRTLRVNGAVDEINVYQVGNYIAVDYTEGEWILVRRDQGSNVVRAIQPLTDLAVLFPRIINQAELIGQEEIADTSSLRYRIEDPTGQGARLIQSLLSLSGEIRSLKLDIWIAVPGGYVASYNFQVELLNARVLNPSGTEVRADQAVTWTYQLSPHESTNESGTDAQPILWPEGAPMPDAFPVAGFATGDFPVPPDTSLLTFVGGVPDLISTLTPTEIDSFYRTELFTRGWTVEGEDGLLRCRKDGESFQLLIAEEPSAGGTRITVMSGD